MNCMCECGATMFEMRMPWSHSTPRSAIVTGIILRVVLCLKNHLAPRSILSLVFPSAEVMSLAVSGGFRSLSLFFLLCVFSRGMRPTRNELPGEPPVTTNTSRGGTLFYMVFYFIAKMLQTLAVL